MSIMKKLLIMFSVCCFVFVAACADKSAVTTAAKNNQVVKTVKKPKVKKVTKKHAAKCKKAQLKKRKNLAVNHKNIIKHKT